MSTCALCGKTINPGTPAVSVVGGQFPVDDPDFFMVDETVMAESHAHLECLLGALSKRKEKEESQA
jgi:hypothetical protein